MQFVEPKDILDATNGGLDIILMLYPQASDSVQRPSRKFKLRENDRTASVSLKKGADGTWLVTDFGGDSTPRNGIGCYAFENNIKWVDALQQLAERFGITGENKSPDIHKPDYSDRPATTEENEGDWSYDIRDSFTDFEISTVFSKHVLGFVGFNHPDKKTEAYARIKTVTNRYNFHPVISYTIIKNRKAMTFSSTDQYPIFLIDEGKFKKIYQPKHQDKGRRFMYVGGSEKPKDFIHGLLQAKTEMRKREDAVLNDDELIVKLAKNATPEEIKEAEEKQKKSRKVEKIEEIILCSGGSDALNLALFGYWVVWLNSETANLEPWHWADLLKLSNKVYQLQDIDETGKRSAHKLALQYLDLYTIELPEELKLKRDARLNPCKDLRDYLNYWNYWDFKNLIKISLPYRFWEQIPEYAGRGDSRYFVGYKYEFDNVQAYNFLSKNGFYRLPFEGKKSEYIFVHIDGNIVREKKPNKVKNYMHEFLIDRKMEKDLRNTLYRSPQLNESSLSNLPETQIDFSDHDAHTQYLFFNNCTWEIKAEAIKSFKGGVVQRFIWEQDVIEYNVKLIEQPPFTITKTGPGVYDIEIHQQDCYFLKYLIQTSRIHWRKELEVELSKKTPEEQQAYLSKHQFDIAGPLLNEEEIHEQKMHLINKIFTIGYLLHRHKDDAKAWAVMGMDNKINDDGSSHGGSGKSIMLQKAITKVLKRFFSIPGTNPKKTDDPHIYDGLSEYHRYVYIDDMDKYMKFRFFFDLITSDVTVNPKNNQPYSIPFHLSPKFAFSTNFTLLHQDPSTERRILHSVFGDYYHNQGETTDYRETRSPASEFGKNLFTEFDHNEWNVFYNTMARCTQFFLSTDEKIGPPMSNVTKRNLQTVMGPNFEDWATVYFSSESGNIDRLIVKEEAYTDFDASNNLKWSPQKFGTAVKAFCQFFGYGFNPLELRNADSGKRIIHRVEQRKRDREGNWYATGEMKAKELIYIQTDFENPLNGDVPGAEKKLPF